MKVIEKNNGNKIDYSFKGSKLNLNDEIIIDLEKYQRDFDVTIDISENWMGMLVMGIRDRYVAQIKIYKKRYSECSTDESKDIENLDNTEIKALPFDMHKDVKLILWSTERGE